MPSTVSLYRYDLTGGLARSMGPMLIGRAIEGVWHTSIVVYGSEFFFDGGVGIVREARPGQTRFGTPYRTEQLGTTNKTESEFMAWVLQRQRDGFGPYDYNLLRNNCNDFTQAAARFLLNQDIPADVREMIPTLLDTPLGRMIRPTLEQATSAPPGSVRAGPAASAPAAVSPSSAGAVGAGLLSSKTGLSEDQEDDLILARTMLESNERLDEGRSTDGVRATLAAVETLRSILTNILDKPTDPKYRAVGVTSKAYTEKLLPFEEYGVCEVLEVAGFRRCTVPATAQAAQQTKWVLEDKDASRGVLEAVVSALDDVVGNIETAAAVAMSLAEENEEKETTAPQAAQEAAAGPSSGNQGPEKDEEVRRGPSTSSPADAGVATSGRSSAVVDPAQVLKYCAPPFPADFTPLEVGREGGSVLFSIQVSASSLVSSLLNRDAQGCFGKCAMSGDHTHLTAYYCSRDGREKNIASGYQVLCIRKDLREQLRGVNNPIIWIPASLLSNPLYNPENVSVFDFMYHANDSRFGVCRAPMGSGVHAGCREPSGRCVVPYGGRAENVSFVAEVLCLRSRVPAALVARVDMLAAGDAVLSAMQESEGLPFGSLAALLAYDLRRERKMTAPVAPLRCRKRARVAGDAACVVAGTASNPLCPTLPSVTATAGGGVSGSPTSSSPLAASASGSAYELSNSINASDVPETPRLLVCHDMAGGYPQADRPTFLLKTPSTAKTQGYEETCLDKAYTVSYWDRMDVFVYFSHHRVTVPPRSWVEVAHRNGVPVLGTLITEGHEGLAEVNAMLADASYMAKVIQRLADLCDVYQFDGYLINIENSVDAKRAKRLVMFTDMLRKRVQSVRPHGQVIWYDAVTIDGALRYQNGLTGQNKPFFDVSDGIFTNYFWNPVHLAMTKAAAANRPAEVYVGVDVFGRNQFGGGRYNTHAATHEVTRNGLSVALFAPGWTAECEGKGRRVNFLRAESKLWARVQSDFRRHAMACKLRAPDTAHPLAASETTALWTSFASGVGTRYFIHGHDVCGQDGATGYCQPSEAHLLPPFQYEGDQSRNGEGEASSLAWAVRLPLLADSGKVHGGFVSATWRTDTAWLGDQCLAMAIPPSGAVSLADWCVTDLADAVHADEAAGEYDVVVDIAALEGAPRGSTSGRTPLRSNMAVRARVVLREADGDSNPSASGQHAGHHVYKPKQLLCLGADAQELFQASTPFASSPTGEPWQLLRFNLSAAVARSHATVTGSDGRTHTRLASERLAEVSGLSLLNTSGSTSFVCSIGGIAIHLVPRPTQPSMQSTTATPKGPRVSPLCALKAAKPWPRYTLHPTSRGVENVLELHDVGPTLVGAAAAFNAASHGAGAGNIEGRTGAEMSVAVSASVRVWYGGIDEDAAVTQQMFLGTHKVAPDASSLCLRVNTTKPPARIEVSEVEYFLIANGY